MIKRYQIMNIGDKMPDLLGKGADGNDVRLSSFPSDMKFIIYFYPKDNTPGCSLEAASLRDSYQDFLQMGYQIIGVSKDSEESHRRFIEKQCLPFPLVSDTGTELCRIAGVWRKKKMAGREYMGIVRTTFVCDHDGTVTDVIEKVNTKLAAEQLFKLLDGRGSINPAP